MSPLIAISNFRAIVEREARGFFTNDGLEVEIATERTVPVRLGSACPLPFSADSRLTRPVTEITPKGA
jgi:hypothetical protein